MTSYFKRLFAYNAWANGEVIAGLGRSTGEIIPEALRLAAHLVAAEDLWLNRLQKRPQRLAVWPENLGVEDCLAEAHRLGAAWDDYLRSLTPAGLAEKIPYRNSLGEEWENPVEDILTHVCAHASYHRGQIATVLRAAGREPVYTDFIHAVRRGLIE